MVFNSGLFNQDEFNQAGSPGLFVAETIGGESSIGAADLLAPQKKQAPGRRRRRRAAEFLWLPIESESWITAAELAAGARFAAVAVDGDSGLGCDAIRGAARMFGARLESDSSARSIEEKMSGAARWPERAVPRAVITHERFIRVAQTRKKAS